MEGDTVKNLRDKFETRDTPEISRPNTNHSNDKLNDSSESVVSISENFRQDKASASDETVKLATTAERINKLNMVTVRDRMSRTASVRDDPDYKRSKSLVRQITTKLNKSSSSNVRKRCRSTERINNYVTKHPKDADAANTNSQNRMSTPLLSPNPNYTNEMQSDVIKPPNKDVANNTLTDPENRITIPPSPPMPMYSTLEERRHKNVENRNLQKRMSVPVFFSPSEDMKEFHSDVIRRPNKDAENTTDKLNDSSESVLSIGENFRQDNTSASDETVKLATTAEIINKLNMITAKERLSRTTSVRDVPGHKGSKSLVRQMTARLNELASSHVREHCRSTERIKNDARKHPSDADDVDANSQKRIPTPPSSPKAIRTDEIRSDVKDPNKSVANTAFIDLENRILAPPLPPKPILADEIPSDVKSPNKNVADTASIDFTAPENPMSIPPPPPMPTYTIKPVVIKRRNKNNAKSNPQKRMSAPAFSSRSEDMNGIHSDVIRRLSKDAEDTTSDPEKRKSIPLLLPLLLRINEMQPDAIKSANNDIADTDHTDPHNQISVPLPSSIPKYTKGVQTDPGVVSNMHQVLEQLTLANFGDNNCQSSQQEEIQKHRRESDRKFEKESNCHENVQKCIGITVPLVEKEIEGANEMNSLKRKSKRNLRVRFNDDIVYIQDKLSDEEGNASPIDNNSERKLPLSPMETKESDVTEKSLGIRIKMDNKRDYSNVKKETYYDRNQNRRIKRIFKLTQTPYDTPSNCDRIYGTTPVLIIEELLQTELDYNEELRIINKDYFTYLKKSPAFNDSGSIGGNILIEEIYYKQIDFYEELAKGSDNIDAIATTFLKNDMLFELYEKYILSMNSCIAIPMEQYCELIKARDIELGNKQGLKNLLLTPYQRIIRYRRLLKNLHDALSEENHSILKQVIDYLDGFIERTKLQEKLLYIKKISIDVAYGKFVMVDECTWINNRIKYRGTIILSEKVIIFSGTSENNADTYMNIIDLNDVYIRSVWEDKHSFELRDLTQYKHDDGFVYVVYVQNLQIKMNLVKEIEKLLWNQLF
ncbi:hypothetical protein Trydic_g13427 [Trypoxylus dichotomus]